MLITPPRLLLRNLIPGLIAVGFSMFFLPVAQADDLLKNGALVYDAGSQSVTGWKIDPAGSELENVTAGLAVDLTNSLRIKIGEPQGTDGQIVQRITVPAGVTKLNVSGWLKSEIPGTAYISIKLFVNKVEKQRLQIGGASPAEWANSVSEIDLGEADQLEVLCRWKRAAKYEGTSVYFAGLALTP